MSQLGSRTAAQPWGLKHCDAVTEGAPAVGLTQQLGSYALFVLSSHSVVCWRWLV